MNTVMEAALKLSREEKIALYYKLQEDLDLEYDGLGVDELTSGQWAELNKRIAEIESGKAELLPLEDFKIRLNEKINAIRGNA